MKFKTSISKITEHDMIIRGRQRADLVKDTTFSDAVFLLLSGRDPNEKEARVFNAMLVSVIDHGAGTTSAVTSRFVMSAGNELNTAVGAGVLALGNYHGGAIEYAMEQLKHVEDVDLFVSSALAEKKVLYGFGHKVYNTEDPRVRVLKEVCSDVGFESSYINKVFLIEKKIEEIKGKKIILNIDGFIAAVLLEMGFSSAVGKGFFIIGRVPGLVAHAMEEKEKEKPVRRIGEENIEYCDE